MKTKIDVIIRTKLVSQRKESISRAIESILAQEHVEAIPVIIVNGHEFDNDLFNALKARSDVRITYLEKASTGAAMRVGRELVSSPFFSFLDDDDELLPDALWTKLQPMIKDATLDLVVSSGYIERDGECKPHIPNITEHMDDPLYGIAKRCWLSSCGGLFRSTSITPDYFDGTTDHQELTLLAFKISINNKKILFLDEPAYIVHDSEDSMSKSLEHMEASERVINNMLEQDIPRKVRVVLEDKYRNTLHVLSAGYFDTGKIIKAWVYHLRSMKPPHTFKYISYTRKLIGRKPISQKFL